MVYVLNIVLKIVFSFVCVKGNDKVFVVFNFLKELKIVSFEELLYLGKYIDVFLK